jgi:acyl-coenzyme A synthetase/AMP-(fatty) acid ligase
MMQLPDRLRQVFQLDKDSWAIEFEGTQYSWGALESLSDAIGRAVDAAGAQAHDVVGWAAQNSPAGVAGLTGLVIADHCAAILNPHMAAKTLCEEIVRQRFPVVIGDPKFWAIDGVPAAVKEAGGAGIVVTWKGDVASAVAYPGLERVGPGPHREPMPDIVIERLSSGTTGPPKRSPQTKESTMNALVLGERKEAGADQAPLTLKRSPSIVYRALAHAGSFAVMLAFYSARPISLHEKFTPDSAIDAIRRHRPKVASFVPTMIKMLWDAQPPPEDLSSLIAIRSGTAPLDPNLQERFEAKYGIPILVDYGATEFGGIAAWTMADHKQFAKQKRGSVGRVVKGAKMRIVDQETGKEITDGRIGILEVMAEKRATDWVSTTDLATIDEDGFLFIRGRADDAIVRGGFKVLPDEVANALRQHPAVLDVAVVGVPDERLGQVPVAVIETRAGHARPDEAELKAFAKERLTPYQVPVAYKFTDKLPRSVSMKVIRPEVLKLALQ